MIEEKKQYMMALYYGFMTSRCIHVVCELNIADIIGDQALSIEQLTDEASCKKAYLEAILSLLIKHNIFKRNAKGEYENTDYSHILRADHPQSIKSCMILESPCRWNAYGEMTYAVKSGKSPFEKVHGMSYFDYLEKDIAENKRHAEGVKVFTREEEQEIVNNYDFNQFGVIADIGGNTGSMLKQILLKHTNCKGVLFDLPNTLKKQRLELESIDKNRWQFIAGDFFEKIPEGADLYFLKRVIHDWDDQQCVQILSNVSKVIAKTGKVIIAETVTDFEQDNPFVDITEIFVFCLMGSGKERTKAQFAALAKASGFKLNRIIPTNSIISLIELTPDV
ncbi:MAG: methyltransferase [Pseudomonadota bacterium]